MKGNSNLKLIDYETNTQVKTIWICYFNRNQFLLKIKELEYQLRKKCSYSKFFWSVFSHIWTKYREYFISLRIQSKCGKIRTGKTPNMNTFYAVIATVIDYINANQFFHDGLYLEAC